MKRFFVIMITLSLLISAGCSNSNDKEEQTSVSEVQISAESSQTSTEVSEKSITESSIEVASKISSEKHTSEDSSEIKVESKAESEDKSEAESMSESSVESKTESEAEVSNIDETEIEFPDEESSEDEGSIPVTNKKIAGFYNLTEYTENGETVLDLKSHNDRGMFATVTINEDGTGKFDDFGTVVELQWNDKYIILEGEKAKYKLNNDTMIWFDESVEMVFERADKATLIPPEKQKVELSGSADKSHAGKYVLSALLIDGEEDITDVVDEEDWYIILNEDGTGKWSSGESILDIKWTKGQIMNENEIFYYTLKDDILSMEEAGIIMEYKKA